MDHAARNGHLEIVQWLHAQGYECTHKAMRYAYENGHFSVVKWLHAFRTEGCLRSIYLQPILGDATMTSAKEMIEWLCVNRCEIDPSLLLRQAVAMSQMDIIELLLDRFGVPWTSDLALQAARHKQVDVLRWIYARNPLLIDQKMLEIAQEGSSSLEVIRWLCEDVGVAVSHQVFEYSGFSQDVVQWLLDTNRLDDDTIQLRQTCTNNERKFERETIIDMSDSNVGRSQHVHPISTAKAQMATSIEAVVRSRELLPLICNYQPGLTRDLFPFQSRCSYFDTWDLLDEDVFDTDLSIAACLESFDADLFTPWLAQYGVSRLEHLFSCLPVYRTAVSATAAVSGRLPLLRSFDDSFHDICLDLAAGRGYLQVVEWIHNKRPSIVSRHAVDWAAQNGHLEVVKYLTSNRTDGCTTLAMNRAAQFGHFEVVKYLHRFRTEGCSKDAMIEAAANGHLEIVEFLSASRREGCSPQAMDRAARNGHLNVVQFLHQHRPEGCTKQAMDLAAQHGHLDIVKFLHFNRAEGCTAWAMDLAAQNSHKHVLEFLLAHRKEGCTTRAMDEAACEGHLDIVRFLHEFTTAGCTKEAMDGAAAKGHLDVVIFLHENRTEGCTTWALTDAIEKKHWHVVDYLMKHRESLQFPSDIGEKSIEDLRQTDWSLPID
ncbi:hypothetical protein LEN26_016922 [Aphanomyces euteiches]|nr:hypothetical protein LEN26_016922 [Aphanomyces euteiches]KAH9113724.1 hypothetical protein AeMF1_012126 [Aphanomyces euteiches]KAH9188296.1 hypothetical protein AeNC1_009728 [Aphanomyces euteiches]